MLASRRVQMDLSKVPCRGKVFAPPPEPLEGSRLAVAVASAVAHVLIGGCASVVFLEALLNVDASAVR